MSNTVPEGWTESKLGSIAKLTMGQSPSSDTYNDQGVGLPFFQGKADFGSRTPKVRYWCSQPSKVAQANSILFSVRAPVGEVNITPYECCIGRGLAGIKAESADQEYLFQKLQFVKPQFGLLSQGSTFEAVNGSEMREFPLVIPPLPEQQKIAAILSSVDDVIEKTRAQIDKLKALKTGMMQELLTKGIGHTAFKPLPKWRVGKIAEIEQIPRSWELVDMASVAKLESGHTPSRNIDEYWGGDIQWLSLHDTKNLSNPVIKSTVYMVTQDGIDNSSARVLPKNTVALSRTASVGNCVMLGEDMATSQDFANYVCGDELYPKYLLHLFRWMQHVWSNLSEGSTHKTIYMPVFKKLQILLPPFDEQERIAEAADKIETSIVAKQKRLEGFQLVKKALMQDLLTGKVRVNVDNKETAVA